MSVLLCDATTSAGKPCKNRSVGEVSGRNFCRVGSHETQVRSFVEPEPEVIEPEVIEPEPELVEEVAEEVAEEVVEEPVEAGDPEAPCPSCGHAAPHRHISLSLAAGSVMMCRSCLHRWTL